jgi:hypothetical protein
MKRDLFLRALSIGLVMLGVAVSIAIAQKEYGRGSGERRYDPATEMKLIGRVEVVKQQTGRGAQTGTHLILKSTQGIIMEVHVGPSVFIQKQGFSFINGDQIEVTGSRVKVEGGDVLLARQIVKEGKVLSLRDERGIPEWSRGRRNGRNRG